MKKTITVFGSSIPRDGSIEYKEAYKLGASLASCGFNLCTGGYQGIMDAVSKGARENGSEAIGITLSRRRSFISRYLTREEKCNTLFERITRLIECGDGYVVLQGGTGTLLELASIWEMMNKGIIPLKPAVCHSQMWSRVVDVMERQIVNENRKTGLIKVINSIEDITAYFINAFLVKKF